MAVLIDTSVVIALERQGATLLDLIRLAGEDAALASITASEILAGLYRAKRDDVRRQREPFLEAIIERFPVLSFDLPVARRHARLGADLAAVGQVIGAHDLIIAATAITFDLAVLTHNVRDFQRVPGLVVQQVTT